MLKGGNGETVLPSEQYATKQSAQGGLAAVRRSCADEARYERKDARNAQLCFTRKAANEQVDRHERNLYGCGRPRAESIESVKSNGASATIKYVTTVA